MTKEIDTLYQAIGSEALLATEELSGRLVVYAEVEAGLIAPGLYYQRGPQQTQHFEFCSSRLSDLLYALWEQWRTTAGQREWRTLAFVVDAGRFFVDITYPEQIDPEESTAERRKRLLTTYFGPADEGIAPSLFTLAGSDAANDPQFGSPDA